MKGKLKEMLENKIEQKIIDRSAKAFSDSIESGQLYEELKKKDSNQDDDTEKSGSEKIKSK